MRRQKRRSKSKRREHRRSHHADFQMLDDYEMDEGYRRWEGRAEYDEYDERPRGRDAFDYDRWRDDMVERSSHRQRIRARDLRKGILKVVPERIDLSEQLEEEDLDFPDVR